MDGVDGGDESFVVLCLPVETFLHASSGLQQDGVCCCCCSLCCLYFLLKKYLQPPFADFAGFGLSTTATAATVGCIS